MSRIFEIEWHDLPLVDFSIGEGGIVLVVTPYDDSSGQYKSFSLKLFDYEYVRVKMDSEITLPTLSEMEVYGFDFQQIGEQLSGELSILTGSTGFWSIEFKNAEWSFGPSI
ncbi:hypothetical protein [Marinobacter xestospongiae]|uniref:Immunity protein 50 n=1 Tax=Marinobacter xestospongiae TaxID=994319 RepID=A0ABU3VWQ4_9GAMM|nr:hypothetical protein [Marinobacter xestospongiae]MDV2078704.1 hypothetical protein [Marinobacter xestospongiae]